MANEGTPPPPLDSVVRRVAIGAILLVLVAFLGLVVAVVAPEISISEDRFLPTLVVVLPIPGLIAAGVLAWGLGGLVTRARAGAAPGAQEVLPPPTPWASAGAKTLLTLALMGVGGLFVSRGGTSALVFGGAFFGCGAAMAAETARSWVQAVRAGRPRRHRPDPGGPAPFPRSHLVVLGGLVVVAVAIQLAFWWWYIEDAAISFSYARNLASGEGLVPWPGGERVEGFSNPLWVALLTCWELVGINSFVASKIMQVALAGATVPLTALLAREAMPGRRDAATLLAPAILATSAQFALWGASGLENALFSALLALAVWLAMREGRRGGLPWSSLAWLGLAVTRPEGIAYAAIGGAWALVLAVGRVVRARRERRPFALDLAYTPLWLTFFFVPFGLFQLWRYTYFAWPFPNTYYAKLGSRTSFQPFSWNGRGWKQLRGFSHDVWQGYFVPAYLAAMVGTRQWRGWVLAVALVLVGVALLFPAPDVVRELRLPGLFSGWVHWPAPKWWGEGRIWVLLISALVLPLLTLGRPGGATRALLWHLAMFAVFFHLRANGDWMKGYRWMAMLVVPAAVLLGVGLTELIDAVNRLVGRRERGWLVLWSALLVTSGIAAFAVGPFVRDATAWVLWLGPVALIAALVLGLREHRRRRAGPQWTVTGWTAAIVLLLSWGLPQSDQLGFVFRSPETGPYKIKKRVDYMNGVRARVHLDRVINLDVDQGAHMWWSGHEMLDLAGLIDVPQGHHRNENAFIEEYVYEERRPHFVHAHDSWDRTTGMSRHEEWERDYVELPPYPIGKTSTHPGNFLRRDLITSPIPTPGDPPPPRARVGEPRWDGPNDNGFLLDDGLEVVSVRVPSPEVAPGKHFFVEVALHTRQRSEAERFRMVAFVANGLGDLASWDLAPGYDWLPADEWRTTEAFVGRYSLKLPDDMLEGTWDLGFVVLGGDGVIGPRRQVDPESGVPLQPPVLVADGLPGTAVAGGLFGVDPKMANGEVRFPGWLTVMRPDQVVELAEADRKASLEAALALQCDRAEVTWLHARRRTTRQHWQRPLADDMAAAFARCWALASDAAPDRATRIDQLARARVWDHWSPEVRERAEVLAPQLYAEGLSARDAEDWETAYRCFSDVLRIDASWSWARRYAEQARDHRLQIGEAAPVPAARMPARPTTPVSPEVPSALRPGMGPPKPTALPRRLAIPADDGEPEAGDDAGDAPAGEGP